MSRDAFQLLGPDLLRPVPRREVEWVPPQIQNALNTRRRAATKRHLAYAAMCCAAQLEHDAPILAVAAACAAAGRLPSLRELASIRASYAAHHPQGCRCSADTTPRSI